MTHQKSNSVFRQPALHVATCVALGWLACTAPCQAEDEIATDRPDIVESSDVVGKGHFQIETSFASERNHVDGVKTRTYSTPTLLRYGIGDAWELRLETDAFNWSKSQDDLTGVSTTTRGFNDVALGVKWHMQDGDETSGKPSVGWLAHVDLPSGTRELHGKGARPSLRMVAEWELPGEWSLGVMPGFIYDQTDDGRRFTAGIFAAVLGKSITDKLRVFVEVAGQQITAKGNGGTIATYDAGVAYLLTPTVQIDFAINQAANKNTPDFAWTTGLSVKF